MDVAARVRLLHYPWTADAEAAARNCGVGAEQIACALGLVLKLVPEDYLLPATTFIGYYNFGFLFGIAIAQRDRSDLWIQRRGPLVGAIGLFGRLTCFVGEWQFGSAMFPSRAIATLTYFGFYSLIILALLSLENKPRPILDETLGAGSAPHPTSSTLSTGGVSNKMLLLSAVHQSLASPRYDAVCSGRHSNFDFDALWNRTADVALALPPLPAAHLKAKPRRAA